MINAGNLCPLHSYSQLGVLDENYDLGTFCFNLFGWQPLTQCGFFTRSNEITNLCMVIKIIWCIQLSSYYRYICNKIESLTYQISLWKWLVYLTVGHCIIWLSLCIKQFDICDLIGCILAVCCKASKFQPVLCGWTHYFSQLE